MNIEELEGKEKEIRKRIFWLDVSLYTICALTVLTAVLVLACV